MGEFIEQQVGKDMEETGLTCAPVTVRVVSSLLMTSYTPERLVAHQEVRAAPLLPVRPRTCPSPNPALCPSLAPRLHLACTPLAPRLHLI